MGRLQMRWKDEIKLALGSRDEEWMNVQKEKIWEDRARWQRLCSVTPIQWKCQKEEEEKITAFMK